MFAALTRRFRQKMGTGFQYISDIHLEFLAAPMPDGVLENRVLQDLLDRKAIVEVDTHRSEGRSASATVEHLFSYRLEARARYLILAGDIGNPQFANYRWFLADCAAKFEKVFVITGNHEYYGSTFSQTDVRCREICASLENVVFLQNECYHFDDSDISLFGATFWTLIEPWHKHAVEFTISDYSKIQDISTSHVSALWRESCTALGDALERNPDRQWVVVSHHLPQRSLLDKKFKHHPASCAFASDVPQAKDKRIRAWVYGHTHIPHESGKFHCAPTGYPFENPRLQGGSFSL